MRDDAHGKSHQDDTEPKLREPSGTPVILDALRVLPVDTEWMRCRCAQRGFPGPEPVIYGGSGLEEKRLPERALLVMPNRNLNLVGDGLRRPTARIANESSGSCSTGMEAERGGPSVRREFGRHDV